MERVNNVILQLENGFNLACLPDDEEIEFPSDVSVQFSNEFLTIIFILSAKRKINADFHSLIQTS